jgi:hypothetical protein
MSEFVHERASPLTDGLMTSRISTSLCRVIFESPEIHDAALFMTVLQSDLTVLKELGYPGASATTFCLPQVADFFVIHQPVDRILRQKAEREAAEKAIAEKETLLTSSAPEMTVQETQTEIPTTQPKIPSPDTAIPAPSPQATPGNTGPEQTSNHSYGPGGHRSPNRPDGPSSRPTSPPKSEDIPPPSKPVPPPPSPNIPERGCLSSKPGPPRDSITPLSNIGMSL